MKKIKKTKSNQPRRKRAVKKDLLEQVSELSGLPDQLVRNELRDILHSKQMDPQKLTLDELRSVVASYLREIMGTLLDDPPPSPPFRD